MIVSTKHISEVKDRALIFKKIIEGYKNLTYLLDLGAGHCFYSNYCADIGFKVKAIDARDIRKPDNLNENVTFIKADFLKHKKEYADIVLMLGIFYHLTINEQKKLLKKYNDSIVILDTHYCSNKKAYIKEDGYTGIYYREANNETQLLNNPKASFTSLTSFWHTEASLYKILGDFGFKEVTKILPEHYHDRTFFICET